MINSNSRTSSVLNMNTISHSLSRLVHTVSFWLCLLLTVGAFSVLVKLGFWQLSRADEKQAMEAQLLARSQQPAISFQQLAQQRNTSLTGVKVRATLRPVADKYVLLDNQTYQGDVGYLAYQLVQSKEGIYFLLERGFVPAADTRNQLPEVVWLAQSSPLTGRLYQRLENPLSHQLYLEPGIPHRIQNLNFAELGHFWGVDLAPFAFQPVQTEWPYPQPWKPVPLGSQKHLGYAFQWFSMAFALFVLSLWLLIRACKQGEKNE